jgi:hypothetical protein
MTWRVPTGASGATGLGRGNPALLSASSTQHSPVSARPPSPSPALARLPGASRPVDIALAPVARIGTQGAAAALAGIKLIIERTPSSAVVVLQSCLTHNDPLWSYFFAGGLGCKLADERGMAFGLLRVLASGEDASFAAALHRFLLEIPEETRCKLLAPTALRRPNHPASLCISRAASGPGDVAATGRAHAVTLVRMFMAHGLTREAVLEHLGLPLEQAEAWMDRECSMLKIQQVLADADQLYERVRQAASRVTTEDLRQRILACPLSSTIAIVLACAQDNHWLWQAVLNDETVAQISSQPEVERDLLAMLSEPPGWPFAAEILAGYFQRCDARVLERLYEPGALKRKNHPVNICFSGASFTGDAGKHLMRVLQIYVAYGLPLEITLARNSAEIQRAASLLHEDMLRLVTEGGCAMPDSVIRCVMSKSSRSAEAISFLIDHCHVPLERFLHAKLLDKAQQQARSYVHARRARCERIPESAPTEDDDDLDG